jgi:hypothetical protein
VGSGSRRRDGRTGVSDRTRGQANEKAKYRWPIRRDATEGEANMIVIIAIAWLLAIWAVVIAFSVYFSQNMK